MDPITSRDELLAALHDAAEIEHQLMCEYLYAAFSLKREPDEGCRAAQVETVRRWCSTLYFVARQEMEHLSLVNSMLTAIGAPPWFVRPNFVPGGLQSPYFGAAARNDLAGPGRRPVDLPYLLAPFSEDTINRFVCGESPPAADLPPHLDPCWCFTDEAGATTGPTSAPATVVPSHFAAARSEIAAGSVQELYNAIRGAFDSLDDLFVATPPEVVIPVEYNVFVFPVTDRTSALAAADLILRQGEGLQGQWTYESHFRHFFEMRSELVAVQTADPGFHPALGLVDNPQPSQVTEALAAGVFAACDHAYVTLLFMLSGLYARSRTDEKYPYLSTALAQMSFAPTMTMLIRSLAEILVRLPTGAAPGTRTGPGFHIPEDDRRMLENPDAAAFGDIQRYLDRWNDLTRELDQLRRYAGLEAGGAPPGTQGDLDFVYQSAFRITSNLRRIYQAGYYSKFVSI